MTHNNVITKHQFCLDPSVGGQLTYLIQVSGTVKFQNKTPKSFQQNFMITAQGDKWKIVSDCVRIQEPIQESLGK